MQPEPVYRDEYITIIGATAAQVMAQFKARGLDREGYAIAGRIGRHQVALLGENGAADLVPDAGLIAATFRRTVAA